MKKSLAPSCRRFYSHPNIPLYEHLKGVATLCKSYVENIGIGDDRIVCVAELIGKCHDFGKYTEFFQDYLMGGRVKGDLATHSRLSAILTSWIVYREMNDPFLAGAAFLCVDSHHASLKSYRDLYSISKDLQQPVIRDQIKSIQKNINIISPELSELGLPEAEVFVKGFENCLSYLKDVLEKSVASMRFEWDDEERWKKYFAILLLHSSLIDADKKDAGRVYNVVGYFPRLDGLSGEVVQLYRERAFANIKQSKINELRGELFDAVERHLDAIMNGLHVPRILTITAPAGSGKTLLGLYVALRLRERLSSRGPSPRVIYCLPYINIIEQTHLVLEQVLSTCFEEIPVTLLLKHHHLFFPMEFREEIPLDTLFLLTDSWESEVVITTFEQLFRSTVGSRNALLKKFHNMANSILILDEVQAIPLEYWRLVRDALVNLAKNLNVTIILMTATMPTIFRGIENVVELVPSRESFFRRLNRMAIVPCLVPESAGWRAAETELTVKPLTAEELVKFFISKWKEGTSALIVLNTIASSKKVYKGIAEQLGSEVVRLGLNNESAGLRDPSKTVLSYLSTSVIPKERKRRINLLRDLLKGRRSVILVSTQVVEAGVDLDFDMAIRDVGPLDSIVQVSGRCNRNWEKGRGEVYIVRVIDSRGEGDAEKVYGSILPNVSLSFLKGRKEVEERELFDILASYYDDVSYRMSAEESEESKKILSMIKALDYGNKEFVNFSLIKEEPKVSVFIEVDDEANATLKEMRELLKEREKATSLDEIFQLRSELRRVRVNMENYVVEVWFTEPALKSLQPIVKEINARLVPHDQLSAYYDNETGFIIEREREVQLIW